MTSHWITECPHCGTSFRVTEQHLRAAKGSVRCGSCLQIFNAINTLFPDSDTLTGNLGTATSTTPEPTPFEQPISHTDVADEHVPMTPAEASINSPSIVEAFVSGDVSYNNPDPRLQWEEEQEAFEEDSTDSQPKWPNHESHYSASSLDAPEINTPDLDAPFIDTPELDEPFLDAIEPQEPWNYDDDDRVNYIGNDTPEQTDKDFTDTETDLLETTESVTENHVDDPYLQLESTLGLKPVAEPTPPASPSPSTRLHAEDILLIPDSRIPSHEDLESEYAEPIPSDLSSEWESPLVEAQEPHIGPYREPFRDALLSELEAEPPTGFQWEEENHFSFSSVLWWICSFILVLTLALQYVMSHYNDFASTLQKPPFDEWMRTICGTVNCRFIKTDLSLVKNENLLIRAHPTKNGYLVLDTMLFNQAPYEQPFPLLDLSFSDMQNKPIARRIFKPEEYLSGELAGRKNMPMNTPMHISFAIKNPSDLATNYELKLIANTSE